MRPIRVLSVMHPFRSSFSGEVEWWLRMIPSLRARGIEVEILTSGDVPGKTLVTETVEGVPVHRIPYPYPILYDSYRVLMVRIGKIIGEFIKRRRNFDIALFHSSNFDTVYASCLFGRIFGWKTVYKMTLYNSDDLATIRGTGRMGRLRLAALGLADGFISISKALTQTFRNAGFNESKLLVAPQGLDLKRFRPQELEMKQSKRMELGIPTDSRVVLFCGGLIQRKGVDILLDAWERVCRNLPDAVLLLVGPGHRDGLEEEDRRFAEGIAKRIEASKELKRSVRLFGFQKEVEKFYSVADVFILASRWEGWPNVVVEAMASGLPCILSSMNGLAEEYLRDKEEGIIVRSEDPAEYAEQIVKLLSEKETAVRMGRQACDRLAVEFQLERVAGRYADFLREVQAGSGTAQRFDTVGKRLPPVRDRQNG